jgi:SnoaL-like domain
MVERYLSGQIMRSDKMDRPDIVNRYFEADSGSNADALSDTFALDAVVTDEGSRHQGVVAIRDWWVAAKKAAQYVAEPFQTIMDGHGVLVRAKVRGQFPGSPVTLSYAFTITNGKIAMLEIR